MSNLEGTWKIDPTHSEVGFSVKHLMISKVKGFFETFNGMIETDGTPEGTKVTGEIETASINTNQKDRDEHLRTNDFFNAPEYPKIFFTSTKIEPVSEEKFTVTGNLTIKGVTQEVVLDAEYYGTIADPYGQLKAAGSVTGSINREDFGITWNQTLETGGILVGNTINLNIEFQAVLV